MTANRLCLLVAAWIVATAQGAFWHLFFGVQPMDGRRWLFFVSLCLALLGANLFLLRLLSPGRTLRWMLSLLVVLTAIASWFIDTYGVAIDSEMLRNVAQTDFNEARDFIGWSLLWRVAWQAGIPMLLIWRARLPMNTALRSLGEYVLGMAAGLALLLGAGLPFFGSYATLFRNQDAARYFLVPGNALVGSVRLVQKSLDARQPYVKVGEDAARMPRPGVRPLLVLVVVGETARAANFSLGGYARDTNPELARRGVYYYTDVQSCGTATAVSLPCMFSDLPRDEFSLAAAAHRDSVLDILQRAGLAVSWIENQSGCKKVCARVPNELAGPFDPGSCRAGECLDETLLHALEAKLPLVQRDAVIVLHAMGSHGPAYHRRVPPDRVRFQPTCATERIDTCTDEQIVNAYDNTIAYTDHVISGLIDQLAAREDRLDAVLLYVSDHGESLGEGGLYLHGQPYLFAPDVQTRVPMLLWFSRGAMGRLKLDANCLRGGLQTSVSHDNLSHTLLGLQDVATSVYRPGLDLLRGCRRN